jgi:Flp pilus assembly pilin Flp
MVLIRSKVARLLARLVHETGAQDLVEYALLAAFIGVAGYIVLGALSGDISVVYDSWRGATPELWDPADPASSAGS